MLKHHKRLNQCNEYNNVVNITFPTTSCSGFVIVTLWAWNIFFLLPWYAMVELYWTQNMANDQPSRLHFMLNVHSVHAFILFWVNMHYLTFDSKQHSLYSWLLHNFKWEMLSHCKQFNIAQQVHLSMRHDGKGSQFIKLLFWLSREGNLRTKVTLPVWNNTISNHSFRLVSSSWLAGAVRAESVSAPVAMRLL